MARTIEQLLVEIDGSTDQLRQELRKAEAAVKQSSGRIDAATRSMDLSFARVTRTVRGLAGAFGIAFGVQGLARHISTQLQAADSMLELTERIGGSVEALSELEHVATMSGVQFNTLTMGLQRMTRRIAEAAAGTGEARAAIRELGLDARELAELPLDQQFEVLAGRLSLVKSESDRVRLAMRLFDSEGVALLQTMTRGSEGIREMREEARRLGLTLSREQAEAAAKANDEIDRMRASVNALTRDLVTGLAPAIEGAARWLRTLSFDAPISELDSVDAVGERFRERFHELMELQDEIDSFQENHRVVSRDALGNPRFKASDQVEYNRLLFQEKSLQSELNALMERRAQLEREEMERRAQLEREERVRNQPEEDVDPLGSVQVSPLRRLTARDDVRTRFDRAMARIENARLREERLKSQQEFEQIVEGLRTQEEAIEASYRRRLDIILANTEAGSQAQADLLRRLDEQTQEQLERIADRTEFEELVENLRTQEEAIEASYQRRVEIILANTERGSQAQADLLRRLDEQTQEQLERIADRGQDAFTSLGENLGRSMQDALTDAFMGIETNFGDMLRRMAIQAATSKLFTTLAGLGGPAGAVFRFLGFDKRAEGGPLRPGIPTLVGEKGPELIVSRAPGHVVPNHKLGGGGMTINVDARGATDPAAVERAVERGVRAAVQISGAQTQSMISGMFRPSMA